MKKIDYTNFCDAIAEIAKQLLSALMKNRYCEKKKDYAIRATIR